MAKQNKSPAFQFYPKDWLSDERIAAMTNEERGEYINLLCYDWINCGVSEALFKGASTVVKQCFQLNGNKWFNPRLLLERKKQEEWKKKSVEGGKRSAEVRWGKGKKNVKGGYKMVVTKSKPMGNSSSSSSSSNIKDISKDISKRVGTKNFIPPTQQEALTFFLEMHSTKGEAETFIDFYQSKGWLVGKTKMKDWRAAARRWIRSNQSEKGSAAGRPAFSEAQKEEDEYRRRMESYEPTAKEKESIGRMKKMIAEKYLQNSDK